MSEFIPSLISDKDMRPIYRRLFKEFPDGFPEILIAEELENGEDIIRFTFRDGRNVYYVKNDTDEKILDLLINEIKNPSCLQSPTFPTFYHTHNDKNVAKLCIYACYIADILDIPLKQIIFMDSDEMSVQFEGFPYVFGDKLEDITVVIPHEMRHTWQRINRPEWFENYINIDTIADGDNEKWFEYHNQPAEIDAQAFGIKMESMIFGSDCTDKKLYETMYPEYRDKIIKRVQEIDIILSKKKLNEIRKILNVNEYMKILEMWKN